MNKNSGVFNNAQKRSSTAGLRSVSGIKAAAFCISADVGKRE